MFNKMLASDIDTKESKTGRIDLSDAINVSQLDVILKYIYTTELEVDPKELVGVWVNVDKFQHFLLTVECERLVMKHLTIENAKDILGVATLLSSRAVIEHCKILLTPKV